MIRKDDLTIEPLLEEGDSLLYVKNLSGEFISINVKMTDTIKQVKLRIKAVRNTPVEYQTLIFGGRRMEDSHTLEDYAVQRESTLNLIEKRR